MRVIMPSRKDDENYGETIITPWKSRFTTKKAQSERVRTFIIGSLCWMENLSWSSSLKYWLHTILLNRNIQVHLFPIGITLI